MTASPVVFLHAHPDDEAIFTGGTIAALAEQGHRVVVVFATGGELGVPVGPGDPDLGAVRRSESAAAAGLLGIDRVLFLGHRDSGLDDAAAPPDAFARADVLVAARELLDALGGEVPAALVAYDVGGIYAHPDHLHVHRVGRAAAHLAGVPTVYEATVDREYLHFVETHLVVEAGGALPGLLGADPALHLSATNLGSPTVLVDLAVDVRPHLGVKRAAMAAHASQIAESSSALALGDAAFAEVYGTEWYLRSGPDGPLDDLAHQV